MCQLHARRLRSKSNQSPWRPYTRFKTREGCQSCDFWNSKASFTRGQVSHASTTDHGFGFGAPWQKPVETSRECRYTSIDPIRSSHTKNSGWPWIWCWVGSLGHLAEVDTHGSLVFEFVSCWQILLYRFYRVLPSSCQGQMACLWSFVPFPSHFEMMLQEVLDHWPQENGPLPIVEKPSTPDGPVPVTPAPSRPLEARDRHGPKHSLKVCLGVLGSLIMLRPQACWRVGETKQTGYTALCVTGLVAQAIVSRAALLSCISLRQDECLHVLDHIVVETESFW